MRQTIHIRPFATCFELLNFNHLFMSAAEGVAGDDPRPAQDRAFPKGWSIGTGRLVRPLGQRHAYRLCEGMRMPTVHHRVATIDDASAIGALHVASWRETYAGLLPQDMLDGLSAENRAAMWATVLDAPTSPKGTRVYVAERAGEIVGFGACGGQRDAVMRERGFAGEIGAIYTLRAQQGAGVGRALMKLMARDLVARPMLGASLWVLRQNMGARRFYERLGGTIIAEKEVAEGNTTLHEIAYGWPDLTHLI